MTTSLLWGLAAVCSFVSAAISYYDGGRPLIVAMQILSGVLTTIAAIKFAKGKGGRR